MPSPPPLPRPPRSRSSPASPSPARPRRRARRRPRQPAHRLWRRSLPAERRSERDHGLRPAARGRPLPGAAQSARESQRSGQPELGRPRDRALLCRPHRHRAAAPRSAAAASPAASTRSSARPAPSAAPPADINWTRHDRGGAARSAKRGSRAGDAEEEARKSAGSRERAGMPAWRGKLRRDIGLHRIRLPVVQRHGRRRHLRAAGDAPQPVRRIQPLAVPDLRPALPADRAAVRAAGVAVSASRAGRSPIPRRSARSSPSRRAGSITSPASPRSPPMPTSSPPMPARSGRRSAGAIGRAARDRPAGRRDHRRSTWPASGARSAPSTLLTLLKALPLVALALGGLCHAAGSWPPPGPPPPLSAMEAAALVILYAFVGFENSVSARRRDRRSQAHHPARADRHPGRDRDALFPGPARLTSRSCRPTRFRPRRSPPSPRR